MIVNFSYLDTPDEYTINERIDYLKSELECPTWMLGAQLKYSYQLELMRLRRMLNSLCCTTYDE